MPARPEPKAKHVTDDRALRLLTKLDGLLKDRRDTICRGSFNTIDEYKSATTVLREIDRVKELIVETFGTEEDDE